MAAAIQKIPAISGADTNLFDAIFWRGVKERSPEGYPLRGSIGVWWQFYENIAEIENEIKEGERNKTAIASSTPIAASVLESALKDRKVNKLSPGHPEGGKAMGNTIAAFLAEFYTFAQQDSQPYFFIKRGTQPLWLVRKTGSYCYDRQDDMYWYPHRIHFEFVRPVIGEEGNKYLGVGVRTIIWIYPCGELAPQSKLSSMNIFMAPKKVKSAAEATTAEATTVNAGAGSGLAPLIIPDASSVSDAQSVTSEKQKKKRAAAKKKKETSSTTLSVVSASTSSTPAETTSVLAALSGTLVPSVTTAFIEKNIEELPVEDVEIIRVSPFEYNGRLYYREPYKEKIYKRQANGSIGPYMGRWDAKAMHIVEEIPDSDRE